MSLVGPRPCLPNQHELIQARERRDVLRVRPGITGLAQLLGIDMSRPERLAYVDSLYVNHASFALDCRLLLLTFAGRGRGDAVARPNAKGAVRRGRAGPGSLESRQSQH
jgi:O-antigen biosynthesis protein WbqP